MAPRLELQALLVSILGSSQVYFQEPSNIQMKYPAIVYKLDAIDTEHAGNKPYKHLSRYQVTVIDRNPEGVIGRKIGELPMSSFERFFRVGDLNHFVYNLYF